MHKRNKVLSRMEPLVYEEFGQKRGRRIMLGAWREFHALCAENKDETRAVKRHTVGDIYPAIGMYRSLQAEGVSKKKAYIFIFDAYTGSSEEYASLLRKLLKIPGLYRVMPLMWKIVTRKTYGTAAGFKFRFYSTGMDRVKFDMLECPYCQICAKYGCRELVRVFCHTDDVCNENLHPKLLWNRMKTMGNGDDCCDFDMIVLP